MKLDEHSLLLPGPHIYVTGDDDEESPDMRLIVSSASVLMHFDLPPKDMAKVRDLIDAALEDAGCCPHGYPTDEACVCPDCTAETASMAEHLRHGDTRR